MQREFSIYYTSDVHGYFSPLDYASGKEAPSGLANCMNRFTGDGNSLIIDGGDLLQGSPLTYYLFHEDAGVDCIPAQLLNLGGYDFVTLGNHDFNYGKAVLENYLAQLEARCLCANVEGIAGVEKTAVVRLKNGLRIGLTGVTTHYVKKWEKPENMEGILVKDAFTAAAEALDVLRSENVDATICIYHGGFENDVSSGVSLTASGENQGWRICQELNFDILLSGHQHMPLENLRIGNTYTCQPPDKASAYIHMHVTVDRGKVDAARENGVASGSVQAYSKLCKAGDTPCAAAMTLLQPIEEKNAQWLDTPVGTLDIPLEPQEALQMAAEGSLIANFFNQVQREASGAELSVTSLANQVKGFSRQVTIRDVVSSYVFPNTLVTLAVNRAQLKEALERTMSYFSFDCNGELCVSEAFLKPIVQHFNFDYFSGITVTADLKRPVGERVLSILFQGEELPEERMLRICMNNYRASGAGGYEIYRQAKVLQEIPVEISELIIDYVLRHREIQVDQSRWLNLIK